MKCQQGGEGSVSFGGQIDIERLAGAAAGHIRLTFKIRFGERERWRFRGELRLRRSVGWLRHWRLAAGAQEQRQAESDVTSPAHLEPP